MGLSQCIGFGHAFAQERKSPYMCCLRSIARRASLVELGCVPKQFGRWWPDPEAMTRQVMQRHHWGLRKARTTETHVLVPLHRFSYRQNAPAVAQCPKVFNLEQGVHHERPE